MILGYKIKMMNNNNNNNNNNKNNNNNNNSSSNQNKTLLPSARVIAIIVIITTIMIVGPNSVYAISPYDSGFNHGEEDCRDIQNGVPQDRVYYFIHGYGPTFHTKAFNDGFKAGWNDAGCVTQELNDRLSSDEGYDTVNYNTNTATDDSFNNRDSVVQPQSQSANTVQSAGCPQQIINGDCYLNQDQNVDNTFGQANRADN